jgi:hypothetical protein
MLLPIFEWLENSGIGQAIRTSQWMFPVTESVHLLGLSVIGGVVLLVDMRLLGLGLRRHPVAQIARELHPWLVGSLITMLISGALLFLSESVKCYYSTAFWFKMTSLLLAILFTFTLHRRITKSDEARVGVLWRRMAAVVSVALWSGVGIGGRWIGFS